MAFKGASQCSVTDSEINVLSRGSVQVNYRKNVLHNHTSVVQDPLTNLLDSCKLEATHESASAAREPKCIAGTRDEVITDVLKWAVNPYSKRMLYFHGPAGAGKTCIQREVADRLHEKNALGGSYFFSSRGLDEGRPVVATLVYQVMELVPACHLEDRENLLTILPVLITDKRIPFRVIISTRPERDIRVAFEGEPLKPLTRTIRLGDYDGTPDIGEYLQVGFAGIRATHPWRSSIPRRWPPAKDLEYLVFKSSSQFIIASTVIKYVAKSDNDPVESLRRILYHPAIHSNKENPFEFVDNLYTAILQASNPTALTKRLLHVIMVAEAPTSSPRNESFTLHDFLGLRQGAADAALCDLHSLVNVPDQPSGCNAPPIPRFYHKSLEDYLSTPARCGDLYQSRKRTNTYLAERCVHHLEEWGRGDKVRNSSLVAYSREFWEVYTQRALPPPPPPGKTRKRRRHTAENNSSDYTVRPSSRPLASLPPALKSFDPTLIVHHTFVHPPRLYDPFRPSFALQGLLDTRKAVHHSLCTSSSCSALCAKLLQIEGALPAIVSFFSSVKLSATVAERVALLPQLDELLQPKPKETLEVFSEEESSSPVDSGSTSDETIAQVLKKPAKRKRSSHMLQFKKLKIGSK
ncbi:hypothetical protein CC1G_04770 [Coprinopsis cinerea okayama7|uniref:Nephrocystin 3-like N-terminal domain-containing protein n=1 Tax=Coprinopsis cinerea (strain Okayama-7 / 130 / ATCC MYA-4618 / FGSC 9003) TaxID=240176 RepID=A8P2I0_COPC7|nr:hypothetical protein CC1G_04770 [Coprinopsis cinerea okayama7\|eukprot:XP_001838326.2 hypothetical protein CC1G_04770 [Coprinopsis cinerea okayama7\